MLRIHKFWYLSPFRHSSQFREKFVSNYSHCGSWYPGHMFKGMLQMQAKLAVVDCIVEVHDARIPFSGRNPNFYSRLTAVKPHILILNKSDLADLSMKNEIIEGLLKQNIQKVLFTNSKASKGGGVDKILPTAIEMIRSSEAFNRVSAESFSIMVIGIPNVGKSSIINRLRNIYLKKKKATTVGPTPGITKSVLEKIKISVDPPVFLYDTPGVAEPKIDRLEVGLRLGLCRTLKDDLIGEEYISDYLLYWLNKHKNFSYVEHLKLQGTTDDIRLLLLQIAKNQNFVVQIRNDTGGLQHYPDIILSAKYFLAAFRKGEFGRVMLDIDIVNRIS